MRPCQGRSRGFKSRLPLQANSPPFRWCKASKKPWCSACLSRPCDIPRQPRGVTFGSKQLFYLLVLTHEIGYGRALLRGPCRGRLAQIAVKLLIYSQPNLAGMLLPSCDLHGFHTLPARANAAGLQREAPKGHGALEFDPNTWDLYILKPRWVRPEKQRCSRQDILNFNLNGSNSSRSEYRSCCNRLAL